MSEIKGMRSTFTLTRTETYISIESLYWIPETNRTPCINYTSVSKKMCSFGEFSKM